MTNVLKTAVLPFLCYYNEGGFKTTALRVRGSEWKQVPGISIAYKDLFANILCKYFCKKRKTLYK